MYQLKSFDSVLCFSRLISLLFPTSSLKNIIAMSILTNLTSVYILLPIDVINVHTNYIFFRIEASPFENVLWSLGRNSQDVATTRALQARVCRDICASIDKISVQHAPAR